MGVIRTLRRPLIFHGLFSLALSAGAMFGLWFAIGRNWTWTAWLLAWLAAVNFVTFLYYGWDKLRARRQGRRIPELVLHGLTFSGGSPCAYVAMRCFRHKTIKAEFRVVFWLIVVLQTALILWLAYRGLNDAMS
jgi:uncharacterized membrane protein YsdA (DUF1294 family)